MNERVIRLIWLVVDFLAFLITSDDLEVVYFCSFCHTSIGYLTWARITNHLWTHCTITLTIRYRSYTWAFKCRASLLSNGWTVGVNTSIVWGLVTLITMCIKTSLWMMLLTVMTMPSYGEVFSSVSDMQAIFQLERNLVGELLSYAEKLQGKLARIKKWDNLKGGCGAKLYCSTM